MTFSDVLIALGLAAFLLVAALPASAHYPYKLSVAGWFSMWKDGKVLPAVAKNQRQNVVKTVNKLRAKCA